MVVLKEIQPGGWNGIRRGKGMELKVEAGGGGQCKDEGIGAWITWRQSITAPPPWSPRPSVPLWSHTGQIHTNYENLSTQRTAQFGRDRKEQYNAICCTRLNRETSYLAWRAALSSSCSITFHSPRSHHDSLSGNHISYFEYRGTPMVVWLMVVALLNADQQGRFWKPLQSKTTRYIHISSLVQCTWKYRVNMRSNLILEI